MNDWINEGGVEVHHHDGIATLTFFHPKSNSLPGKVLASLAHTITEEGNRPENRVLVLKSKGEKAFCAGASFDELLAIDNRAAADEFFMGFARVIQAIQKVPIFVIGRVQGKAVGGGVGVAAATDYCLAHQSASVKLSELAVGIGPFVVGPAVERKIGTSAFTDLAIHATNWRSAQWAREKGLFMDVFESHEELDAAIGHLAQSLSESSPDAMRELKRIAWAGTEHWDQLLAERAAISGRLILEPIAREILAGFRKA